MDDDEREYLEGKIQGLERVTLVLIQNRQLWWPDLATRLEWVMGFATLLDELITDLEKSPVILTPRGKGQCEAIAQLKSQLLET